jgi:putative DNA-binding protein
MSIKYKLYQLKNKTSQRNGYWYARAAYIGTVGTKQLATRISERCTVTEPDILAVISALVSEMSHNLQNGMRVKLNDFGTFKLSISSEGVKELKDFSAVKHIKRPHVLFQPETHVGADKVRIKNFISGVKVEELESYEGTPKSKKNSKKPSGGGAEGGHQPHP